VFFSSGGSSIGLLARRSASTVGSVNESSSRPSRPWQGAVARPGRWPAAAFAGFWLACLSPGQAAAPLEVAAEPSARDPRTVAVIGASVSAGFSDQFLTVETPEDQEHNRTLLLSAALRPLWPEDSVRVRNFSNSLMFRRPREIGEQIVKRAQRERPDLVIAVDFLFWFGYSISGGDKRRRLELQKEGLALLEGFACPVVVGDYPQLPEIDPRMLPPFAIPDGATLAALNAGVRAWAEERGRKVRLFPLSARVQELLQARQEFRLDDRSVLVTARDLLQTDGLHATRLGMAMLASFVAAEIRTLASPEDALHPRVADFPSLVKGLGLADLMRAATAPADKR
jgi:hypothetical protein